MCQDGIGNEDMKEQCRYPFQFVTTTHYRPSCMQTTQSMPIIHTSTIYHGQHPSAFKYPPCSSSLFPSKMATMGFAPSLVGFAPCSTLFYSSYQYAPHHTEPKRLISCEEDKHTIGPKLLSVKPGQKQNTFHPLGPYS